MNFVLYSDNRYSTQKIWLLLNSTSLEDDIHCEVLSNIDNSKATSIPL
jgi:hypothetical protein